MLGEPPPNFAEEMKKNLQKYRDQGMTKKEIAAKIGCGTVTVERYIRRLNLPIASRKRLTDTAKRKIVACFRKGMALKEISKHLDIPYPTITEFFRKDGIRS